MSLIGDQTDGVQTIVAGNNITVTYPAGSAAFPTVSAVSEGDIIGAIIMYAGVGTPTGWLECDGTAYDTNTYLDLFNQIRYSYGGTGTQFNVPNLISIFPRGVDEANRGATGGGSVTLTTDMLPAHTHNNTLSDPGHTHTASVSDSGHAHANTLSDPGHTHTATAINSRSYNGLGGVSDWMANMETTITTSNNTTGITISNATATTGISVSNSTVGTGVSITNGTNTTAGNAVPILPQYVGVRFIIRYTL